MADGFTAFAATERTYIQTELKWFKGGAKLISPSGDDITTQKVEELEARLEHADSVMNGLSSA
jgi:hypothetical protein